jgi:flagellar M-ring protein FliF
VAADIKPSPKGDRQRRIIVGVFALVCALLAIGYYLFLRTDYAVLYTDLKPADAAAIVAELDSKGIAHRLRDEGTTILVPVNEADTVRLAVAGSDIPLKGSVGFELFNKSDMGLTDFAQKINYQRALQGELARTIMTMDGIETARVHLAMPERSLFRGNRSTPKAAIEVVVRAGQMLEPARVAGIQRLVASSVPDLPLDEVVVLDGRGHVVSPAAIPAGFQPAEVEEQQAAQNYYAARARSALATALPGLQFDIKTLMMPVSGGGTGPDSAVPIAAFGKAGNGERNFRLQMTVLSPIALNAEEQSIARRAIASSIGFDENRGDAIAFEQGPVATPSASAPYPAAVYPAVAAPGPALPPQARAAEKSWFDGWTLLLAALFLAAAATLFVRLRRGAVSTVERDAFVERIRQRLATGDARV